MRTSISFRLEQKCSTQPYSSLTVNSTKDVCSASERAKSLVTAKSHLSEKSKRALGKRAVQDAAAQPSRHSDLGPTCGAAPTIKTPGVLLLEQQKREKQEVQRRRAGAIEPVEPLALHELDGSDSESDEPLAKKHAKRVRPVTGSRKKHNQGNENAPPPPTKRRSRAKKAPGLGDGTVDEATDHMEKAMSRHHKVAPDAGPPPSKTARGVSLRDGSKVQVLQEKDAPTNVPRKRKERVKALLYESAKGENEHEPPRKKSRRVDPPAGRYAVLLSPPSSSLGFGAQSCMLYSRGGKENKAISRSAHEAATIGMDKVLHLFFLLKVVVKDTQS